jgi:3-isopropylmalate dehydrogenase
VTSSIVILPGDGIGPEVATQASRVLQAIGSHYDLDLNLTEALVGGAAFDATL